MMRLWYGLTYVLWMGVEIVKGSIDVAKGAYSRGTKSSPAIVEFPLRCTTDAEIIAMASSITITPGTLVVGTAHGTEVEHPSLFVHALFAESREQVIADLTDMEDRLLTVMRGKHGAGADPQRGSGGFTDPDYVDGQAAQKIDDGAARSAAPAAPVSQHATSGDPAPGDPAAPRGVGDVEPGREEPGREEPNRSDAARSDSGREEEGER